IFGDDALDILLDMFGFTLFHAVRQMGEFSFDDATEIIRTSVSISKEEYNVKGTADLCIASEVLFTNICTTLLITNLVTGRHEEKDLSQLYTDLVTRFEIQYPKDRLATTLLFATGNDEILKSFLLSLSKGSYFATRMVRQTYFEDVYDKIDRLNIGDPVMNYLAVNSAFRQLNDKASTIKTLSEIERLLHQHAKREIRTMVKATKMRLAAGSIF
ncbi:MAG: hypothetical protein JST32_19305, partial [Bacteroidetes bacterium]|nr:hypothetical protein [Bacteroidota bacterium]